MHINFGSRAVSCKIVYYGPGLSGKTTNIQKIHEQMPTDRRGELTSIKTDGDRTLFFDFMALDLGKVAGMDTRFQIYTVPGQVFYNATRKLVLQGADGVVFVADSTPDRLQDNIDSWQNLQDNLAERNVTIHDLPVVIQWNKRDLADALEAGELNRRINTIGAPTFEAVACRGEGVLQTLKAVCGLVSMSINASQVKKPAAAETLVPVACEAAGPKEQAASVEKVSFTSRRINVARPPSGTPSPLGTRGAAAQVASEHVVSATAVVEEPAPTPLPPGPRVPSGREAKTRQVRSPLTFRQPTALERTEWRPTAVAAGVLAAAAVLAALLYVLSTW